MRAFGRILSAAALAATLALAGQSSAQEAPAPNPAMAHYRAYTAALGARDLPAAETAAAAALAASEARDGEGGRTAAFALNLAIVRLWRARHAEAIGPARRARALANNPASGVNPLMADLIVGRIALALNEPGAADQLAIALRKAAPGGAVAMNETFDAATALGAWAMTNQNFALAREAWSIAANFAAGSGLDPDFARARAQINLAAAIFQQEVGPAGQRRIDRVSAGEAHAALYQAKEALRPLAEVELANGEMTLAQRTFAEAIMWDAILRAKVRTDGGLVPRAPGEDDKAADGVTELSSGADPRPRCFLRAQWFGGLDYPREAGERGFIGAVAVRLRLDERGETDTAQVVGNLGNAAFLEAVRKVRRWRFEKRDDSPAGCRMAMTVMYAIVFTGEYE